MNDVLKFLQDCGTFFIATVDGDKPEVRPFGAAIEYEGKICLVTNKKKAVYREIKANPNVAITAATDSSWLRLNAVAEEVDSREARIAMLEAFPDLGAMYTVDDGIMTILKLASGKAAICSFTEAPKEYDL